jgi:putative aminopeptidase FrvX
MTLPALDPAALIEFLTGLLNTPSPTGYTEAAIQTCERALAGLDGLTLARNRKGGLLVTWPGETDAPARALTAHVDTLGAMVKEIKLNGRLKLSMIGGYSWNVIENEGCTVFTQDGQAIRGTIQVNVSSSHVWAAKTSETKRDAESMEVRLDVRTSSPEETRAHGIQVGDFIALDPRVEVVNGFVRSRHLDDKACVASVVAALQSLHAAGLRPKVTTHVLISNYEEVGHGASSGFPADVAELLTVDMAAIGEGQTSDEFHATLCVKDSHGPYHHGLSNRLRRLAEANGIDYKVDIYPSYGSDGEAFWFAGADAAVALIGPGVDASHSYERTHTDALVDTARWVQAYLLN